MYVIKFLNIKDTYVGGFDKTHQIVQFSDLKNCKKYKTLKGATNFVDKYSNCGYGMDCDDVQVVFVMV